VKKSARMYTGVVLASLAFLLIFSGCSQRSDKTVAGSAPGTAVEKAPAAADSVTTDLSVAQSVTPAASGFKKREVNGFTFQWNIDGKNLNVILSYQTTGWVAVGFDPSRMMKDANIIIGYVKDGTAVVSDQYGSTATSHRPDTSAGGSDNVSNVSGSESGGVTELRFTIPLDSGESTDRAIVPGQSYRVIFAHGPNGADDERTYHAGRTGTNITF